MNTATSSKGSEPILSMKSIGKRFPGVKALSNVSLDLFGGEVHALMGENGAGKSTLMKVLTGVYRADEGEIFINGKSVLPTDPIEASSLGITIIHQELNQVPEMTVAENFFLGREITNRFGVLDRRQMNTLTSRWTKELGLSVLPESKLGSQSVAVRQMLEIAKAISTNAQILVMDEPTTALSAEEVAQLFVVVRGLRAKGLAIVYISHRMDEVFELCDRVTILRDGTFVTSTAIAEMTRELLITKMVGRKITELFPVTRGRNIGEEILGVNKLSVAPRSGRRRLHDITLHAKAGEIVGLAGLMGAGRTELLEAIYGVPPRDLVEGEIRIGGQALSLRSPRDAIKAGIGFVTEDRKGQSLALVRPVGENASMVALNKFSKLGFLNLGKERAAVDAQIKSLRIKTPSAETSAGSLSGGNQQKVVLAKFLLIAPRLYLLDEPTQGIDVGSKAEIYSLINDLAIQGAAVVIASSDMLELLSLCDRIIVLCEGRKSGELLHGVATQENILELATKFHTNVTASH